MCFVLRLEVVRTKNLVCDGLPGLNKIRNEGRIDVASVFYFLLVGKEGKVDCWISESRREE